jgi:hypothetical protein
MTPADTRKLESLHRQLATAQRKAQKWKRAEATTSLALARAERAHERARIARAGWQSRVNNINDMIVIILLEEANHG